MFWTQNYDPVGHWLLSMLLAALVGLLVLLQAYVDPFTRLVL